MSDDLACERRGAVLVVRLNRPEARNALNRALIDAVGRMIATADSDPAVRAVVLTGTGDRAFCAGMDLREFAGRGLGPAADADAMERYRRFLRGEVTVPVVGAANGTAVAGGFELLLACDLVVASVQARFGLPAREGCVGLRREASSSVAGPLTGRPAWGGPVTVGRVGSIFCYLATGPRSERKR